MIAIMIPIKPYWFAKILNGEKSIEVRKNKALAKAIQKLIDKQGYAPILGYCSKDKKHLLRKMLGGTQLDENKRRYQIRNTVIYSNPPILNGKVVARFYCDKVEELTLHFDYTKEDGGWFFYTNDDLEIGYNNINDKSCLDNFELLDYCCGKGKNRIEGKKLYAVHISQLEIFDKPKELGEFRHTHCDNLKNVEVVKNLWGDYIFQHFKNEKCKNCKHYDSDINDCNKSYTRLTKAPSNYCYVEVDG